ncbi:uncharacterized protein si:dkey-52l18.4 isoform X2 [Esox lucius]|uniref:uncharacterized protein si:dkey-52l18.4 isoform X2 n=1 Tax=Esox lucius TaxID=8010 RepID=UPI000576A368|nr:uncharacterized protein si:dkey-52l18.4 isoform X2 [Esox lucius]
MYNCLFLTLSLAVLSTLQGNNAEECVTSVLAKRLSVKVPEGGSLSLSCIVQHCGNGGWTGGWGLSTGGQFLLVCPSPRHHLSNSTLTTNRTHLHMDILNVNQSDCGMYQCQITWFDGQISVGHMTSVNITAVFFCSPTTRPSGEEVVLQGGSVFQRLSGYYPGSGSCVQYQAKGPISAPATAPTSTTTLPECTYGPTRHAPACTKDRVGLCSHF